MHSYSGSEISGCCDVLAHTITPFRDSKQCGVSSVQKELPLYKVRHCESFHFFSFLGRYSAFLAGVALDSTMHMRKLYSVAGAAWPPLHNLWDASL